jgi:tRNA(fMet)-specific endonuclease VapC
MNSGILLDTNVAIALLNGDATVRQRVTTSRDLFVPVIVMREIYFGAEKSARRQENLARAEQLAARSQLLTVELETARRCGQIRQSLRQIGRPIPVNDLWIAAIAMQHQLTVATRDSHFDHVPMLAVERW